MTDPRGRATAGQRLLAWVANLGARAQEGYPLPFMEEIVRTHGLLTFNGWAEDMNTVRRDLEAQFGAADGQLLMALAAFWEGCSFCSRGHLRASNLFRFREEGELFPLRRQEISDLQCLPDEAILMVLRERLQQHADVLDLIERQYALRAETASGTHPQDDLLRASLGVWALITDCSIMVEEQPEVPPLAKSVATDRSLIRRYEAARNASE